MVDLIKFVLTNFWPFVGMCILLSIVITGSGSAIAEIIQAIRRKQ